jgi:hypothetical protein
LHGKGQSPANRIFFADCLQSDNSKGELIKKVDPKMMKSQEFGISTVIGLQVSHAPACRKREFFFSFG